MKIGLIGLVVAVLLVCLPTEILAGNRGFGISITIGGCPGLHLGYGYPGSHYRGYGYEGYGYPRYSSGGYYGRLSYPLGPPRR